MDSLNFSTSSERKFRHIISSYFKENSETYRNSLLNSELESNTHSSGIEDSLTRIETEAERLTSVTNPNNSSLKSFDAIKNLVMNVDVAFNFLKNSKKYDESEISDLEMRINKIKNLLSM